VPYARCVGLLLLLVLYSVLRALLTRPSRTPPWILFHLPDSSSDIDRTASPVRPQHCKHHFTETALAYIHDHLINAFCSHKISRLCLLDLSVAFDAIHTSFLSLVSHLGSGFMALSLTGSSPTCLTACFVLKY